MLILGKIYVFLTMIVYWYWSKIASSDSAYGRLLDKDFTDEPHIAS